MREEVLPSKIRKKYQILFQPQFDVQQTQTLRD